MPLTIAHVVVGHGELRAAHGGLFRRLSVHRDDEDHQLRGVGGLGLVVELNAARQLVDLSGAARRMPAAVQARLRCLGVRGSSEPQGARPAVRVGHDLHALPHRAPIHRESPGIKCFERTVGARLFGSRWCSGDQQQEECE